MPSSNAKQQSLCKVNVVMPAIASLRSVHLFCVVWLFWLLASLREHVSLLARCPFIANMTNSSNSVYVKGRIGFLLAINVQSEITGKK